MASSSDEAFIAQFAALNANHTHKSQLLLPKSATNASNIDHCALVRIITEKVIIDGQFATTMKRAWAVQSRTTFSMIDRNICLVEFVSEQELLRVTQKGVWSYRGDVVAMRRATDQADLINPRVSHIEVWTQMHRVPHQVVSKEGITTIAKSITKPLSQVSECFTGGHKYHKVKLLLPLEHAILDTKQVQHHSFGSFPVLLVYERLSKVCLFCSKIRHENQECQDKARMERISLDPRYADRADMKEMTDLKVGAWINDSTQLPELEHPVINQTHHETSTQTSNQTAQPDPLSQNQQAQNNQTTTRTKHTYSFQARRPTTSPNTQTAQPQLQNLDLDLNMEQSDQNLLQIVPSGGTNPQSRTRQFASTLEAPESSHAKKKRVMEASLEPPPD